LWKEGFQSSRQEEEEEECCSSVAPLSGDNIRITITKIPP